MKKGKMRPIAFILPLVLLGICIIATMMMGTGFADGVNNLCNALLANFGWLFDIGVFGITILAFLVYVSPLGKVKVGGRNAKPKINKLTYFAISLCTILGAGLPVWGAAEIMAHYSAPPASEGVAAFSLEAAKFGMRAALMDWTFAPYAVYALPTILMAFTFYNMKRKFSLGSILAPLFGDKMDGKLGQVIDGICVFTLVCGLIASIGTGAESLIFGVGELSGGAVTKNAVTLTILVLIISATFVISAASGLMRGIKTLSNFNIYVFAAMLAFVFICGPTRDILSMGVESIGNFAQYYIHDMLNTRALTGDNWAYWWPIFYFAVYLAWALIASAFLGRISYGFTFKQVATYTFVWPSVLTGIWMIVYSVTTLKMELDGLGMADAYAENFGSVVIRMYQNMPLATITIAVFLVMLFTSFVTAADSCTNSIAGLCTEGLTQEDTEPPVGMKVFWGILMGVAALICMILLDINGIKAVCNIGSIPALIIELIGAVALWRILWKPGKYDTFKEDYDEYGRPLPQEEERLVMDAKV
ncbi:MAG: BCCT family transporter, partial [Lachnospiraceae bacterium]|nr:BCCT family transporter [Candidatus Equihabitans merdae]